ncbi:hypothetical protein ACWDYH_17510 [Nocardia goodfellowii]
MGLNVLDDALHTREALTDMVGNVDADRVLYLAEKGGYVVLIHVQRGKGAHFGLVADKSGKDIEDAFSDLGAIARFEGPVRRIVDYIPGSFSRGSRVGYQREHRVGGASVGKCDTCRDSSGGAQNVTDKHDGHLDFDVDVERGFAGVWRRAALRVKSSDPEAGGG